MGRLAVCQIVVIVLYFFFVCVCVYCPGRGLLLSGKRQMVSMDGSLLNWLAALLIPLHATLTCYQSQNSLRLVPRRANVFCSTKKEVKKKKKWASDPRLVAALGF